MSTMLKSNELFLNARLPPTVCKQERTDETLLKLRRTNTDNIFLW